jgi:uncharacterized membrane protein
MGSAGRLAHLILVSRRRTHGRRPALRRAVQSAEQTASTGAHRELPTGLLAPMEGPQLAPSMSQLPASGQVDLSHASHAIHASPAHEAPPLSVLDMPLTQLSWHDPFEWLSLGWRDFSRAPLVGLFYGACFVLMGWLLLACFHQAPQYTLALSAGFLLLGPFLCLGLYEVSRRLERGEPLSMWSSLTAWRISSGQLAIFAGVLLVLEMLWGRSAMIMFAISFDGMPDFSGPLSSMMTDEYLTFFAGYIAVGAVFASIIFAISVISMPMMLDKSVDAISAGLASMRLVSTQTGVMLLWAGLITLGVGLAMLPGFLGLMVVGPVIGHASWHAYRAATTPRTN